MAVPNSSENNRIKQLRMELVQQAEHLEFSFKQRNERSITPEFIHKTHAIAADLTDEIERSSLSYERDLSEIIENLLRIRSTCDALLAYYEDNARRNYYSGLLKSLCPEMNQFLLIQNLLDNLF